MKTQFCIRATFAFMIAILGGCGGPPSYETKDLKALSISLYDLNDQQRAGEASTEDSTKIGPVLKALSNAVPTNDHKCADSGQVRLLFKNGRQIKIGILPGHHAEYYELRVQRGKDWGYSMFKIERAPFLDAMAGLGLDRLNQGKPE